MDIILFGHSLTFDITKMDQKKREKKENQAIYRQVFKSLLNEDRNNFLSFFLNK